MKVGIVGFPGAGKTTVFNALTGLHATVGAYQEAGKVNLGTIKVPDARIDRLSEIFRPRKTTYAETVFVDLPGSADASASALDRGTLVQMRDADALVQVIRGFPHPFAGSPAEPLRDYENFKSELILADLAVVEKRLERVRKEQGKGQEVDVLERCKAVLDAATPLRKTALSAADERVLAGFGLLSSVPLLVVLNVEESQAGAPTPASVAAHFAHDGVEAVSFCAQIEMELTALEPLEQAAFLAELGVTESARARFIQAAYALLDLISFLTTGEDEVRAWPIRRGTTALKAAGKVHSDIERGFIRAEVVPYTEFMRFGSEAKCREAGKLRLEGKDYVVQDGDMIHFRFNV